MDYSYCLVYYRAVNEERSRCPRETDMRENRRGRWINQRSAFYQPNKMLVSIHKLEQDLYFIAAPAKCYICFLIKFDVIFDHIM